MSSLSFYDGEKGISLLSNSNAGAILCKRGMEGFVHPKVGKQPFVFVKNPIVVIGDNCNIGNNTVVYD
jgi:UDP-3-O-[3-hydroxymyristoyl] glucosamine N-acyltransferase